MNGGENKIITTASRPTTSGNQRRRHLIWKGPPTSEICRGSIHSNTNHSRHRNKQVDKSLSMIFNYRPPINWKWNGWRLNRTYRGNLHKKCRHHPNKLEGKLLTWISRDNHPVMLTRNDNNHWNGNHPIGRRESRRTKAIPRIHRPTKTRHHRHPCSLHP